MPRANGEQIGDFDTSMRRIKSSVESSIEFRKSELKKLEARLRSLDIIESMSEEVSNIYAQYGKENVEASEMSVANKPIALNVYHPDVWQEMPMKLVKNKDTDSVGVYIGKRIKNSSNVSVFMFPLYISASGGKAQFDFRGPTSVKPSYFVRSLECSRCPIDMINSIVNKLINAFETDGPSLAQGFDDERKKLINEMLIDKIV